MLCFLSVVRSENGRGGIAVNDYFGEIENITVLNALLKAKSVVERHFNIVASISGGSDSDIVLDMLERVKPEGKHIRYVWFDTGLEYQATKDHLRFLEGKYGITIERVKAIKPIPVCVKEYGVPFLSKQVSERIADLQRVGFDYSDNDYQSTVERFPTRAGIKWWCNANPSHGSRDRYNIEYNPMLKEFMLAAPPQFAISAKCCTYAKKKTAKQFQEESGADLECVGVRRDEGGVRATAYKNCYTESKDRSSDHFRPVWYLTDEDKRYYEDKFGVTHSDCYTRYGFKRTGCVGCPFNINVRNDLEAIKRFEPQMYKACMNIFGKAYEYTDAFHRFRADMKRIKRIGEDQLQFEEDENENEAATTKIALEN